MSKLPNVTTSIFATMSKMANDYQAINLAQGFPNFAVDEKLAKIITEVVQKDVHQYQPIAGYPPLLNKIAQLILDYYQREVDPETEILVTSGATQALFTTILALIKTDEEVLILDPSFDNYEAPTLLAHGKAIRIELNEDYSPNWERIEKSTNANTRLLVINSPHNSSGRIWAVSDFIPLENLLDKHPNLLLLSDEVYEFIAFEQKHISIHSRPKLINRSIIVSSFGKSFHLTGWRMGYLVAPDYLMQEIKKVHQYLVFSVNSLAQAAISEYLDVVSLKELSGFYQEKRDYFRKRISTSRFELLPCEGTYFQVVSYAGISDENDVDFCKSLLIHHGVAAIPLSPFSANGKDQKLIRFCFAKDNKTLEEAAKRLCKV